MYPAEWLEKPPHNVWLGASAENQKWLDRRINPLLNAPAVLRFLSCEPLLGPLRFPTGALSGFCGTPCDDLLHHGGCPCSRNDKRPHGPWARIGWIIGGGESGSKPRPTNPDWARGLRDECKREHVPFFWKQWGEWVPVDGGSGWLGLVNGPLSGEGKTYPVEYLQGEPLIMVQKVGKKAAGNLLDGVHHLAIPTPLKPGQQLALPL